MEELDLLEMLDEIKTKIGDEPTILDAPPADLWDSIEIEMNLEDEPVTAAPVTAEIVADPLPRETSNVTLLDHHRRRRRPGGLLLGAIAASVVAALVVGGLLRTSNTVVAEVALDSLTDGPTLGSATVVDDGDGSLRLDVSFQNDLVPGEDGSFELWVIDTEVNEMFSLGTVGSSTTAERISFDLPDGVSIADFPIVDISWEPNDGVETHSGDSRFRGVVDA